VRYTRRVPQDLEPEAIDAGEINALLGRGSAYSGKLTFEGRVRIDGRFEGEVFSEGILILGEGAEVRASIDVGTLLVLGGEVWGDIRASQLVEVHAAAKVHGDIRTPRIFIDRGALFDGQCTMDGEQPSEKHSLSEEESLEKVLESTMSGIEPYRAETPEIGEALATEASADAEVEIDEVTSADEVTAADDDSESAVSSSTGATNDSEPTVDADSRAQSE